MKRRFGLGIAVAAAILLNPWPRKASFVAIAAEDRQGITITSLNLAKETDIDRIVRELKDAERVGASDIFMFQEVARLSESETVATAVAKRLGYSFAEVPSPPKVAPQGIAVLSRFPLANIETTPLKAFNLKFHSRTRYALSAAAQTPIGRLRVWTLHLDTRINPSERLEQLSPVLRKLSANDGSAIVGGDFNTTRFNWFMNVMPTVGSSSHGRTVRMAFEQIGFQSPFSDDQVTFPFMKQHLDWFFVNHVGVDAAGVVPIPFSDHYAVWTKLGPQ
jgi:endonuclease/exonuclease/phosphatase family metal-dependent hydrolase